MALFDQARRLRRALLKRGPAIRVKGRAGDRDIDTTVDAEIARYYVERYWRSERKEAYKDALIDEAERLSDAALPTREQLQLLSRRLSVDFAALFLLRRIQQNATNRQLHDRFRQEVAATIADQNAGAQLSSYANYVTLFVPGFLYRYDPESGADFGRARKILAQLGFAHHLIEIDQIGPVEHNAQIVAQQIAQHARDGRKIVLVGASSAAPAITLALTEKLSSAELDSVRAWVNIGGILRGAQQADAGVTWPWSWLLRPIFRLKGWSLDAVKSYTTAVSAERFKRMRLPSHLFILNFVGIPLSGDVSDRAWRGYLALLPDGPNDGLTPIVDAIAPGGVTIAEIGLDHYFLDPAIDAKTVALARTVLGHLENR